MKNSINWFEIPARDMDKAIAFYEKTLAVTLQREVFGGEPHAMFPVEKTENSVTGAIVSSVAFLESSINELYLEFQRAGDDGSAVPTRAHTQLETLWPSTNGAPLMLRYQVALQSVDAERFNERRSTYKNVERLLELRDALVHHQPERHDERQRHQSLQRRLRTCFSPNTLLGPRARWFPDLCLGAGCATWALRSAEAFSNEFCIRMGIPSRVRPTRDARRPRPSRGVVPSI